MNIYPDCLPCMLRQVWESAVRVIDDENIQMAVLDDALRLLALHGKIETAPELCASMHQIVREYSGCADPYQAIKVRDIATALSLHDQIKVYMDEHSGEKRTRLLKVSAVGNIMDAAVYSDLDLPACLESELARPFAVSDEELFWHDLRSAKNVLIIGDNAGEVAFDIFLAEYLSQQYEVIYAVREGPVLNDATIDDARRAGMDCHARLMTTGCVMPGTVISSCSAMFKNTFDASDIVISKGQGNFEGLSDTHRSVYFLLKAKCRPIAHALNVTQGDYVFMKNNGRGAF